MRRLTGRHLGFLLALTVWLVPVSAAAQPGDKAPRIFGYFQTSLHHFHQRTHDENSFNLQQLNVFFAKRLTPRWRAFINFEFTNTFSSERDWGAFSIEEAWLGYSPTRRIHLKAGLLIPIFNNLNEIKNKTPLLPYIIRPIVYEASFVHDVGAEQFIPRRAFLQAYGHCGIAASKLDFAVYVGNSPNVITRSTENVLQTGVDSTNSFLVGGRLGLRRGEFKLGVSGTADRSNELVPMADSLGIKPMELKDVPRYRLGADVSYRWQGFAAEAEYIRAHYSIDALAYDWTGDFAYFTVGYHPTEPLFVYTGYWWMGIEGFDFESVPGITVRYDVFGSEFDIRIPVAGVSLALNDLITLKGQYGYSDEERVEENGKREYQYTHFFAVAVSAMF